MPPRPRFGQLRSLHPSVLITAPSEKSITMAAAGTVVSANAQLTHGHALRPRASSPRVGSAALCVPPPTARLLLAFIPQFLPAARRMQTAPRRRSRTHFPQVKVFSARPEPNLPEYPVASR